MTGNLLIKSLRPGKVTHSLIVVILVWYFWDVEISCLKEYDVCVRLISPVLCYLGFVGYLLVSVVSAIVISAIAFTKVLGVENRSMEHKKDVEQFKEELNEIEKEITGTDLEKGFGM